MTWGSILQNSTQDPLGLIEEGLGLRVSRVSREMA